LRFFTNQHINEDPINKNADGIGTALGTAVKLDISVILAPDCESIEFALNPKISPVATENEKISV